MTINTVKPNDPLGRDILGKQPMRIPTGTDADIASYAPGSSVGSMMINRDNGGLDIWVNGVKKTLVPAGSSVSSNLSYDNDDTYTLSTNEILPVAPNGVNDKLNLSLPSSPSIGDTCEFFDVNGDFNSESGVKITDKIDGWTRTHYYTTPGGYWKFQYYGGEINWALVSHVSADLVARTINPITTNALGSQITKSGYYICNCDTEWATYFPPMNPNIVPSGTEITVKYYTGDAHNIYLSDGSVFAVKGQNAKIACSGATITYRLIEGTWHVIHYYYDRIKADTTTDVNNVLDYINTPWLLAGNNLTVNNLSLPYFAGNLMDGLFGENDYWYFSEEFPAKTGIFVSNTQRAMRSKVKPINSKTDFDLVFTYDNLNNQTGYYIDIGMPWSVAFEVDSSPEVNLPRVTNRLTINVRANGASASLASTHSQYQPGDEIRLVASKYEVTDANIFTLKMDGDTFTEDDGTTNHSDVTITGPGHAVIYKGNDGFWRLREEVKLTSV